MCKMLELQVTCFACGIPSSHYWARRARLNPEGKGPPFFPQLTEQETPPGAVVTDEGIVSLCAYCYAQLDQMAKRDQERADDDQEEDSGSIQFKPVVEERRESGGAQGLLRFICAVCAVKTYRKRVRALPLQKFQFLAKSRKSGSISITLGDTELVVVCLDCSETLWIQSDEYDRWGLPESKRHFNWMARPPPPEDSEEANLARLPSGKSQLPRSPPTEPELPNYMSLLSLSSPPPSGQNQNSHTVGRRMSTPQGQGRGSRRRCSRVTNRSNSNSSNSSLGMRSLSQFDISLVMDQSQSQGGHEQNINPPEKKRMKGTNMSRESPPIRESHNDDKSQGAERRIIMVENPTRNIQMSPPTSMDHSHAPMPIPIPQLPHPHHQVPLPKYPNLGLIPLSRFSPSGNIPHTPYLGGRGGPSITSFVGRGFKPNPRWELHQEERFQSAQPQMIRPIAFHPQQMITRCRPDSMEDIKRNLLYDLIKMEAQAQNIGIGHNMPREFPRPPSIYYEGDDSQQGQLSPNLNFSSIHQQQPNEQNPSETERNNATSSPPQSPTPSPPSKTSPSVGVLPKKRGRTQGISVLRYAPSNK